MRNKDEKLYTIDLVCYGVPSPMIYIEWRAEIERVYKKKIAYVHFRDKSFGYAAPNVKIVFKDTDIKKIYFIIYEKTNEHNKAEARVLFFLCIWAVVGLFFTVTIHVDRA